MYCGEPLQNLRVPRRFPQPLDLFQWLLRTPRTLSADPRRHHKPRPATDRFRSSSLGQALQRHPLPRCNVVLGVVRVQDSEGASLGWDKCHELVRKPESPDRSTQSAPGAIQLETRLPVEALLISPRSEAEHRLASDLLSLNLFQELPRTPLDSLMRDLLPCGSGSEPSHTPV